MNDDGALAGSELLDDDTGFVRALFRASEGVSAMANAQYLRPCWGTTASAAFWVGGPAVMTVETSPLEQADSTSAVTRNICAANRLCLFIIAISSSSSDMTPVSFRVDRSHERLTMPKRK
jgi:hypothetical protein